MSHILFNGRDYIKATGSGTIADPFMLSIGGGANDGVDIGNVDVSTMPDNRESWRAGTQSFTTTDTSTNTFTVPSNTEWQILSLYITLASTATAGNRVMVSQALTSGNAIIKEYVSPVTQAASLTYRYQLAPDMPNDASLVDTTLLRITFAPIILTAGQKFKVYDRAAIAAAADDMTIQMQIASRSIA